MPQLTTFTYTAPSTGLEPGSGPTPALVLHPAYPNPFNAKTTFSFSVPTPGAATLTIHDLAGARVRTLLLGELAAGHHHVPWDGRSDEGRCLGSELYLYTIEAGGSVRSGRVMMVK